MSTKFKKPMRWTAAKSNKMLEDTQLMADGCFALMRIVYGENNWYRWNNIKQQMQMESIQTFIAWLLDLAEQEIQPLPAFKYNSQETDCPEDYPLPVSEYEESTAEDNDNDDITDVTPIQGVKQESGYSITSAVAIYDEYHQTLPTSSMTSESDHAFTSIEFTNTDIKATDCIEIVRQVPGQFICQSCCVSLSDIMIVEQHMSIKHQHSMLLLSCSCCSQNFQSTKDYIAYHKSNALFSGGRNKFVCNLCAKRFSSRSRLEDHISSKHDPSGPKHQCSVCQKRFTRDDHRKAHEKQCNLNATTAVQNQAVI